MSIKVTSWVLNHAPVDNPALVLTLLAMAERANDDGTDARQSVKTIAGKARVSVRTAQRYLRTLEDMGLISRGDQHSVQHLRPDRRPMVYDINIDQARGDNLTPREADGVTDGAQRGDRPGTNGVTPVADKSSLLLPTEEEPVLDSKSVAPSMPTPTGFDAFWVEYPRRAGKQAAIKAWAKAVKHTTPAAILGGALRLAQDPNREDQFTPHPATWLNEGRWEDDRLPDRTHTARTRPSTTDAGIAAIQAMKHPQRLEIA